MSAAATQPHPGRARERTQWFDQAVGSLVRIYELVFGEHGARRGDADTARLWLAVMTRVYGLGGLAVRLSNWAAVRQLASRRPRGEGFQYFVSWLRHALTMAARAQILDEERQAGLIAHAHNVVREVAALHPDTDAHSEDVLNSLCQFDTLGALVILSVTNDRRAYYPNFSRYYSQRTEPAFVTVIRDQAARQVIYPGDDDALAAAIRHIDEDAQCEGFNYNGWVGLRDPNLLRFLEEHPE